MSEKTTDAEWNAIVDAVPMWEHVDTAVSTYGRRVAAEVRREERERFRKIVGDAYREEENGLEDPNVLQALALILAAIDESY